MRLKIMATVVVASGLLAACGGTSSSSSTSSSAATAAAQTTSSPAVTSSSSTASAPASFASTGNCTQLEGMAISYEKAIQSASGNGTLDFSTVLKGMQSLADASPSDIHASAELVVHAFGSMYGALQQSGYKLGTTPTAAQLAVLASAGQQLQKPDVQSALKQIQDWIHANCKA
jgi:hypothetical protein